MGFQSVLLEADDFGIVTHFCVIPGGLLTPAGQFKPLFGASHLLPADTDQQLVEKFGEENNLHHKVP